MLTLVFRVEATLRYKIVENFTLVTRCHREFDPHEMRLNPRMIYGLQSKQQLRQSYPVAIFNCGGGGDTWSIAF